ncbi:MAG: dihydrodipicolinate synthase family protein [Acidobacteria bacterium]|nr:dihydrodipicolinate synthase family protein [Acidobacteriota bacterium]
MAIVTKPFGIYAPTVTAFNADESLSQQGNRAYVRFLLDSHVHGLAPMGSAGEFIALTEKERMQVMEWTLAEVNGRIPVYAGTGHYSTRTTIELSKHAKEAGATGLMLMPPYLLRPPKRDVMDHFRRVREAIGLPIMVDNVPILAGVELLPADLKELADEDVIHGVKWSHAEISRIQDTKLICKPNFAVFVGIDLVGFAGLAAGADGYIGGLAIMVPRLLRTLFGQFRESQNLSNARQTWERLLPLVQFEYRALMSDSGSPHWLAVCREAAALRGIPVGTPRAPLRPIFPDQKAELKRLLTALGEL